MGRKLLRQVSLEAKGVGMKRSRELSAQERKSEGEEIMAGRVGGGRRQGGWIEEGKTGDRARTKGEGWGEVENTGAEDHQRERTKRKKTVGARKNGDNRVKLIMRESRGGCAVSAWTAEKTGTDR